MEHINISINIKKIEKLRLEIQKSKHNNHKGRDKENCPMKMTNLLLQKKGHVGKI